MVAWVGVAVVPGVRGVPGFQGMQVRFLLRRFLGQQQNRKTSDHPDQHNTSTAGPHSRTGLAFFFRDFWRG